MAFTGGGAEKEESFFMITIGFPISGSAITSCFLGCARVPSTGRNWHCTVGHLGY